LGVVGKGAESLAAQVSGGNQEAKGFLGGRLVGQNFQRSLEGYRNLLEMARDLGNDGVVMWWAWVGLWWLLVYSFFSPGTLLEDGSTISRNNEEDKKRGDSFDLTSKASPP